MRGTGGKAQMLSQELIRSRELEEEKHPKLGIVRKNFQFPTT